MLFERPRPVIKFCGTTRPEDAEFAASLGAAYVGVIFAGGPRHLTVERAAEVFAVLPDGVGRVGVFGGQPAAEIAEVARRLGLAAVQLHGARTPEQVAEVRRIVRAEVWPVIRVGGTDLSAEEVRLLASSRTVVLDSFVPNVLGGSGVAFRWEAIAGSVQVLRGTTRIVLAGGLRPDNVAKAVAVMAPHVLDVSSGVESSPGIKDHERMRLFRDAAMVGAMSALE